MAPRKSKLKSSSTDSDSSSEIKRFKEETGSEIRSSNEECELHIVESKNNTVSPVVAALENPLILQEIFKFLSPADQRICCEVSEKWQAIAGPMIFEYHLEVDRDNGAKVKTSKGYLNPTIEERNFSLKAETEFLEAYKGGNCFISLDICGKPSYTCTEWNTNDVEIFVRKFSSRLFKLRCPYDGFHQEHYKYCLSKLELELLTSFPNCEDYGVSRLRSLDLFFDVEMPTQMGHLRRVYIGPVFTQKSVPTKISAFLQMIPNLQEIHGVPFTLISEFEKAKKLHLVRSIRFHEVDQVNLEVEAMKTMIRLGIKFKFLRLGRSNVVDRLTREKFIRRNKRHLNDLLEIGKDTLQHLSLQFDTRENLCDFPEIMSALTHITLKNHKIGPALFPRNFNFSKCFPKLTTISFPPMTLDEWGNTGFWWGPKGKEFRKRITNLRCTRRPTEFFQQELLQSFPCVNRIEFVPNNGDTDVDGVISD